MSLSKYNSAPVNPPQSTNLAPLKEIVEKSVVDSFIFQLQNELTTGAARICQLEALQEGNQKDKIRQDEISANTIGYSVLFSGWD